MLGLCERRAVRRQGANMGFIIFTVFMVCLIGTSFAMGLVGVVFDAVRGSSAVPTVAAPESELSLIRSDGLGLQSSPSAASAACVANSFNVCR
jgi:hypothetical protein